MTYRTIRITEVNPEARRIIGRDEYGQKISIATFFLQPLSIMPKRDETWLCHEQGGQWLLDRRADDSAMGMTFDQLSEGDVRIEAKNDLVIQAEKVRINNQELTLPPKIGVSVDGEMRASGSTINLLSDGNIDFWVGQNDTSVDIRVTNKTSNEIFAPTLLNSWVNFGADHRPARFYRLGNQVFIEGMVKDGTVNVPIFTLPIQYRPAYRHLFICLGGPGVARVDVYADGNVIVAEYRSSGNNTFVSLEGIVFNLS